MIMDQKVDYYKLPFYKRITSIFLDLMLVFTAFILLLFVSFAIIPSFMNKDEKLQEYNNNRLVFLYNTPLYEVVDLEVVPIYEDDNITEGFKFSGNLDKYLEIKSESELFIFTNNEYIEIGSKEDLDEFYKVNWNLALGYIKEMEEFQIYDVLYQEKLASYLGMTYTIPALVSIIGLLILVPFFNKDGKTLSKMMFKISVVNEDLSSPNRLQIFTRQFFFILFLPLIFPSIVSLIMFLFGAKGKTLHDYLSLTRPIDSNVKRALLDRKKKEQEEKKEELEFKF